MQFLNMRDRCYVKHGLRKMIAGVSCMKKSEKFFKKRCFQSEAEGQIILFCDRCCLKTQLQLARSPKIPNIFKNSLKNT